MNNYDNSSHIKEVVEKTKEIEKHVFGAPSPHRSWRDFILVIIILGAICGILIKLTMKFVVPRLVRHISKKTVDSTPGLITVSEHVPANYHNRSWQKDELKLNLEQQICDQSKKLNDLMHKLNMEQDRDKRPIRDE